MDKAETDEPIGWMHNGKTRVDIAHKEVKSLWLKVSPKRVEHYTIPVYTRPQSDEINALKAEVERLRAQIELSTPKAPPNL